MKKNSGCLSIIFAPFFPKDKSNTVATSSESEISALDISVFHLRDDFLTKTEHSFYQVLKAMMKESLVIFPKVSLAEVFFVDHPRDNYGAFGRIRQKRVDFLICDPLTTHPRFAIELDDQSHNRADRKERDEFVDRVFKASGLPLIHIPVQLEYNTQELSEIIKRALQNSNPPPMKKTLPNGQIAQVNQKKVDTCPKCGGTLVLRVASQGVNKGKKFLGCVNYPKCQFIQPVLD
ncbi:MAG: topoisomerase [Anaerolinea sp.]|nr:topoisomerase [Anaerolinea sp.]